MKSMQRQNIKQKQQIKGNPWDDALIEEGEKLVTII